MKILFMGTPDFAVSSLMALTEAGHDIPAVVTMPDRPKGRGHKMTHTPVYEAGESIGATVYTPESIKEEFFGHVLRDINPDVIVCRSQVHIDDALLGKVAHFCDVDVKAVVNTPDAGTICATRPLSANEVRR